MRKYGLSQDALFAMSKQHRYRRGSIGRWFFLFFAGLLLLAGCSAEMPIETVKVNDTGIWECISHPHIRIAFDSYDSQGYAYFRLFVYDETFETLMVWSETECRATTEDLYIMLADGQWAQITAGEPLLLPPPPGWDNQPRKKGTGIRINGSTSIPMQTLTPLPDDKQITIEKVGTK